MICKKKGKVKGVHLVWLTISMLVASFLILCVTEGIYVLVQRQVIKSLFFKSFQVALSERIENYLDCGECDSNQNPTPLCCISINLLEELMNFDAFPPGSFDSTLERGGLYSVYIEALLPYLAGRDPHDDVSIRIPFQCQQSPIDNPLCTQFDFTDVRAADVKFIIIFRLLLHNSKITKRVSAFCFSNDQDCRDGVSCGVFNLNYPPKIPQVVCSVPVQFMFLGAITRVLGLDFPEGANFLLNTVEHVVSP